MKKFYYLYSNPQKREKRITMVGFLNQNNLQIGLSECSEKDQFNKKLGRQIAEGRAQKNPTTVINIENKTQKEILDILYEFLDSMLNKNNYEKIKKVKHYNVKSKLSKDNPFVNNINDIPMGTQEIKGDNCKVKDYSLPEQGKLTQKEIDIINKYKNKGFDFTKLVRVIKEIEEKYKKK